MIEFLFWLGSMNEHKVNFRNPWITFYQLVLRIDKNANDERTGNKER